MDVNPGDTLEILAQSYGTTVEVIQKGNCLLGVGALPVGSYIFVPLHIPTATNTETPTPEVRQPEPTKQLTRCSRHPTGWVIYVVKKGNTLGWISATTGASVAQLRSANCLNSNNIRVGQGLFVPYTPPEHTQTRRTATAVPPRHPSVTPPNTAIPTSISENTSTPAATQAPPTVELPTATPVIPTDAPPESINTSIIPTPTSPNPSGVVIPCVR